MRRLIAGLVAALSLAMAVQAHADDGLCHGEFPNPITDICWSCIFPISIGGQTIFSDNQEDNASDTSWACSCGSPVPNVGITVSFWEPVRIAETVRTPYCFPTLAGTTIDMGVTANNSGAQTEPSPGRKRATRGKSVFHQEHWFINPLIFYLEVLLETRCLEQNVFDIAYVTELDPLWVNTAAAFILSPDALLFANPVAIAACAADCLTSSTGFASDEAYWCAGCQGSMYPLVGWADEKAGSMEVASLLLQRMTNKLHREGLMWAASGEDGTCGYYVEPIMKKSNYKYQAIWPSRQTDKDVEGRCCQPYGRTSYDWGMGKTSPVTGEDHTFQVFRKRDCCQGAW